MANLSRRSGLGEGIQSGVSGFFEQYNARKKRQMDEEELRKKLEQEKNKQGMENFQKTGLLPDQYVSGQAALQRKMQGIEGPMTQGETQATAGIERYQNALLGKMTRVGRGNGIDPTILNNAQLNVAIKNMEDQKYNNQEEWNSTPDLETTLQGYYTIRKQRGEKAAGGKFAEQPRKELPVKEPGFWKTIGNDSLRGATRLAAKAMVGTKDLFSGSDLRIVLPSGKVAKAKDQSAYDEAIRKGAKPFQP